MTIGPLSGCEISHPVDVPPGHVLAGEGPIVPCGLPRSHARWSSPPSMWQPEHDCPALLLNFALKRKLRPLRMSACSGLKIARVACTNGAEPSPTSIWVIVMSVRFATNSRRPAASYTSPRGPRPTLIRTVGREVERRVDHPHAIRRESGEEYQPPVEAEHNVGRVCKRSRLRIRIDRRRVVKPRDVRVQVDAETVGVAGGAAM